MCDLRLTFSRDLIRYKKKKHYPAYSLSDEVIHCLAICYLRESCEHSRRC